MAAALVVPVGELTAFGIGKETTAGVPVVPSQSHAHEGFNAGEKNTLIPRTGARKRLGQTYPATGTFDFKASLGVESDPDAVGQLMAFAMGNQSAPANAVMTTYLSTTANTGSTSFIVENVLGMVVGQSVTFNLNGGTQETLTIATIPSSTTITTTTSSAHTHNANETVTSAASSVAKQSTLKMGNPLPTFTMQVNRVTDAVQYFGCKVGSMALSMTAKGGLSSKFSIDGIATSIVGSPATPSFSTKLPLQFHNPNSFFRFNGAVIGNSGQVSVQNFSVNVANGLIDSYYSFGNGRFKLTLPEGQRTVTTKIGLGFETNAAYLAFWGGTTGPGLVLPGVPIEAFIASTDLVDATNNIPYCIDLLMPNCFIEQGVPDIKPNGVLMQDLTIHCAESSNGAQDDLSIVLTNANSSIY